MEMVWSRKFHALVLTLLLASCVLAQAPAPQPHGTWTATVGSRTFRGSWGAEMSAHDANSAQGYWTLVNETGERIMQGTWSAQKTAARWHGNWTMEKEVAGTWQSGRYSGGWWLKGLKPRGATR